MTLRFFALAGALACLVFGIASAPAPKTAKRAIDKSLPLLQRSAKVWFQQTKCGSCHHQSLNQATVALAKERGFTVDEEKSQEQNRLLQGRREKARIEQLESTGAINGSAGFSFLLFGYAAAQIPKSDGTDATVYYLLGKQAADGSWPSFSHRPPLEDTPVTLTAMAMRGINLYAPGSLREEANQAILRGRRWLAQVQATTNEEATFQILGLLWSNGDRKLITHLRDQLIAKQRIDGGWAQIGTGNTDAYATGQALVAIHLAGLPTTERAFQKGISYLISTQMSDGSWLVETRRRFPGLPYFETGFPHRQHQFISFAGTSWASLALIMGTTKGSTNALLANSVPTRKTNPAPLAVDPKNERLLRATLSGTVHDMRRAIRAGADVNGKSLGGGTPLLYAIREPEKVSLLLAFGAKPNIASTGKTTPLMLAAEYAGNRKSMELLLKAGANPHAARDPFESVFSLAASTGDVEKLKLLILAGAKAESLRLGAFVSSWVGNLKTLRFLLDNGVDPNATFDDKGETMLTHAAIDRQTEVVKLLLARGANPSHVAKDGYSVLILAAMHDPGSTQMVELLLAAGADPEYRTPDSNSPLVLALK